MASIPLYNKEGGQCGSLDADDRIFNSPVREHIVHAAVVAYLANRRRGQARTKTRSGVRGGGRKPWRQKGTGRARAGTINSPLWRHGGVAHGPRERDYSVKLPRKMLKAALVSSLAAKLREGHVVAVEEFVPEEPKTKKANEIIKNLKLKGNLLILVERADRNFIRSFRNIEGVRIQNPDSLNVYDVVGSQHLVFFGGCLEKLQKRLLNEKS